MPFILIADHGVKIAITVKVEQYRGRIAGNLDTAERIVHALLLFESVRARIPVIADDVVGIFHEARFVGHEQVKVTISIEIKEDRRGLGACHNTLKGITGSIRGIPFAFLQLEVSRRCLLEIKEAGGVSHAYNDIQVAIVINVGDCRGGGISVQIAGDLQCARSKVPVSIVLVVVEVYLIVRWPRVFM